jgi:hypothetical protein
MMTTFTAIFILVSIIGGAQVALIHLYNSIK